MAPPGSVSKPPRRANGAWVATSSQSWMCRLLQLLVGHLLFLFPGGHKDGRNYADAGEAGRHQPIAGNVAEAVDQHRGDGRESKGKGYNEKDPTEARARYLRMSELTAVLALLISP